MAAALPMAPTRKVPPLRGGPVGADAGVPSGVQPPAAHAVTAAAPACSILRLVNDANGPPSRVSLS
ncbi:hypothetical protein GCM10009754_29290 [Amycolatopsis minnesotensis]|uniref:Uncharacterized protein n=1 Tax=Amycolatopsis minnesotensis TaxID=337894 RepID=A0ABN2QRS5_9PSEU